VTLSQPVGGVERQARGFAAKGGDGG
jgi:hypothetical protein